MSSYRWSEFRWGVVPGPEKIGLTGSVVFSDVRSWLLAAAWPDTARLIDAVEGRLVRGSGHEGMTVVDRFDLGFHGLAGQAFSGVIGFIGATLVDECS